MVAGYRVEGVDDEARPLGQRRERLLLLLLELLVGRLADPRRIHHDVHGGLADDRRAQGRRDRLHQDGHDLGVHVDDLAVAAAEAALAHVAWQRESLDFNVLLVFSLLTVVGRLESNNGI